MGEYIITIKGGFKARIENGPVKRFGRPEYIARRLRDSTAPFFISFGTDAIAPGNSDSYDFADTAYGDWWRLRDGDILMVFTYSLLGVSVGSGFSTMTSGRASIFWKRWKTGDPTTASVSVEAGAYSVSQVRYVVLRGASTKGNPFTVATGSGSGDLVTYPSIKATTDNLVVYTHHHDGTGTGSSTTPDSFWGTQFDINKEFFQAAGYTENGRIKVGIPSKTGTLDAVQDSSTKGSGNWTSVSMTIKADRPLKRVLAGPHTGTNESINNPESPPLLVPGDIVVTYVVSGSSTLTLPSEALPGWAPVAGTPVQSGSDWLHVYWKRWSDDEYFFDYSGMGFLRLYSVARGAAKSGNPFEQFNVTSGSGSAVSGSPVTAKKNQIVFYAGVAKFAAGYANALGPVTASGVSEFAIDSDSDSVDYYTFQYRAASAYGTGAPASFSSSFNRSGSLWAVTLTLKK